MHRIWKYAAEKACVNEDLDVLIRLYQIGDIKDIIIYNVKRLLITEHDDCDYDGDFSINYETMDDLSKALDDFLRFIKVVTDEKDLLRLAKYACEYSYNTSFLMHILYFTSFEINNDNSYLLLSSAMLEHTGKTPAFYYIYDKYPSCIIDAFIYCIKTNQSSKLYEFKEFIRDTHEAECKVSKNFTEKNICRILCKK